MRTLPRPRSRCIALWLALALPLAAGCGGDDHSSAGSGGSGGSGGASSSSSGAGAGGCATTDPGSDGSKLTDPEQPCATLERAGEPSERVVFVDKGHDTTITDAIELMWAWRYAARVADGPLDAYEIEEEYCSMAAGEAESCVEVPRAMLTKACEGPLFGAKFAIDPSQYKVGENVYRISIRMKKGCDVVSSDTFTMHVTYAPPP